MQNPISDGWSIEDYFEAPEGTRSDIEPPFCERLCPKTTSCFKLHLLRVHEYHKMKIFGWALDGIMKYGDEFKDADPSILEVYPRDTFIKLM